jgi:hypothetical protein
MEDTLIKIAGKAVLNKQVDMFPLVMCIYYLNIQLKLMDNNGDDDIESIRLSAKKILKGE